MEIGSFSGVTRQMLRKVLKSFVEIFYSVHEVCTRDLLNSITFDDFKFSLAIVIYSHTTTLTPTKHDQGSQQFSQVINENVSQQRAHTFFLLRKKLIHTVSNFFFLPTAAHSFTNNGRKLCRVFSLRAIWWFLKCQMEMNKKWVCACKAQNEWVRVKSLPFGVERTRKSQWIIIELLSLDARAAIVKCCVSVWLKYNVCAMFSICSHV